MLFESKYYVKWQMWDFPVADIPEWDMRTVYLFIF